MENFHWKLAEQTFFFNFTQKSYDILSPYSQSSEESVKIKQENCHRGFWKQYRTMMFETEEGTDDTADVDDIKVGKLK